MASQGCSSTTTASVAPEGSWVNQSQGSVSIPAQDWQSSNQADLPEIDWWGALMGEESGPSATSVTHLHPVSAHGWTGQGSQDSEPSDCVDPRVLSADYDQGANQPFKRANSGHWNGGGWSYGD